jgi:GTP cyclohydrolase II
MITLTEDINGNPALLAVERAVAELRRGRAVVVRGASLSAVVAAIETTPVRQLDRLLATGGDAARLLISGHRARALGWSGPSAGALSARLPMPIESSTLRALAAVEMTSASAHVLDTFPHLDLEPAGAAGTAALALAKQAHLLPALVLIEPARSGPAPQMLEVAIDDIAAYERPEAEHLQRVSEAQVPLAGHEDCRLVLYRDDRDGTEHVAVLIGQPDLAEPVPVRLHSSCLTGDLLGSLRCDCGEQLRGAVERLARAGGGVLLYLAQEGRGIGLANKLRAYTLQDTGLDTLDADQHLGFEPDERTYESAASMLRDLGIGRVRLYTNNPRKVEALEESGIEVVERVHIGAPVNPHNERYIRTKQERAGHYKEEES